MLIPFGLDLKSVVIISSILALFCILVHYYFFGFKIIRKVSDYSPAKIYFLQIAFFLSAIIVEFGSIFIVAYYNRHFVS